MQQTSGIEQTEMDISVVVPFYNSERHIEDCVKALLAQDYPSSRYEIIMVDNNSKDSSAKIIGRYPRIKLLSEQKQGSYAARNRGIAASKGAIIAFTDADCTPSTDWLESIIAAMHSPGIELIQGRRLYAVESPALSMLAAYESERAAYTFSGNSSGIYYGYTNNMAVRRGALDRCGPFLEIIRGADSIFLSRVVEEYSREVVRYVPEARIRHLEITSVWCHLRKKFIHGRSFQQNFNRRKKSYRPLTRAEHSALLRRTVQQRRYSALQTLYLIILVSMGMLCFILGRLSIKGYKLIVCDAARFLKKSKGWFAG